MNNIFSFATSELSQDAFLCWLINWASPEFAKDERMHRLGVDFVSLLIGGAMDVKSCEVKRQWKSIDILCLINDEHVIVIEDKSGSREHSDQLKRYKKDVAEEYPTRQLKLCYIQTGAQGVYDNVVAADYEVITRESLLSFFETNIQTHGEIRNNIFYDYYEHLSELQTGENAYKSTSLSDWNNAHWVGFYKEIARRLVRNVPDIFWDWAANPNGGFWYLQCMRKFSEREGCTLFLQLEQAKLCIKMEVDSDAYEERISLRTKYSKAFLEDCHDFRFKRPERFGYGRNMTVAVYGGNYRVCKDELIDIGQTCAVIEQALNSFEQVCKNNFLTYEQ